MMPRLLNQLAEFTEASMNGTGPIVDTVRPENPPSQGAPDPRIKRLFDREASVGVRKPSDAECQRFENPDFPDVVEAKYKVEPVEEQYDEAISRDYDLGTCDLQTTLTQFDTAPENSYQPGRRGRTDFGGSGSSLSA